MARGRADHGGHPGRGNITEGKREMDLEKRYRDFNDNKCDILQMVEREPEWAANRIQEGEKVIAVLIKHNKTTTKCPHCGSDNITWMKFVCNECDEESD